MAETSKIRTGALTEEEIEKLEAAGGRRCQKYGKDRIYFNAESLGLSVERYNSGNISHAELMGKEIPNAEARGLVAWDFFVDVKTGERAYASESGLKQGSKWGKYARAFNNSLDKIVDAVRRE